jgi:hypothetical protein
MRLTEVVSRSSRQKCLLEMIDGGLVDGED